MGSLKGSLKNEWQQQRLQRQQDVAQRRQIVHDALAATQAELQQQAQVLRQDLAQFRAGLLRHEDDRQQQATLDRSRLQQERLQLQQQIQVQIAEMQAQRQQQATQQAQHLKDYTDDLRQQVQEFLRVQADERQQQAMLLLQRLDEYVDSIRQQSAEFLAMTTAARSRLRVELLQDLQQFHDLLSSSVAAMRQDFQQQNAARHAEVQALASQTQDRLADFQNTRVLMQVHQSQILADFVDRLREDVAATIAQLQQDRMVVAEQLAQQLATFRTNLRSLVWGDGAPQPPTSMDKSALPKSSLTPTVAQPAVQAPSTSSTLPPTAVPVPKPISTDTNDNGTPAKRSSAESAVATSAPVPVSQATMLPEQAVKVRIEQQVYDYVQAAQGARLAEIESAVGINRFQAVDALRSLMQRGVITQHDRVYLVQKEISL